MVPPACVCAHHLFPVHVSTKELLHACRLLHCMQNVLCTNQHLRSFPGTAHQHPAACVPAPASWSCTAYSSTVHILCTVVNVCTTAFMQPCPQLVHTVLQRSPWELSGSCWPWPTTRPRGLSPKACWMREKGCTFRTSTRTRTTWRGRMGPWGPCPRSLPCSPRSKVGRTARRLTTTNSWSSAGSACTAGRHRRWRTTSAGTTAS